ncbi:MAG: RICIN domain-containing protein [Lachnospiraceae bacterium]
MRRMKKVLCFLLAVSLLFSLTVGMETKAADSISVSNATYPDWIKKGSAFILRGTVKSDSSITALTASICDGHGNAMYSKTVKPNSKTYDLKGIDAAMRFDKLSANPYTYRVVAKNSSGTHTVIMKPFTVYSGNKPEFVTNLNTAVKYQICVKEDSSMVVDTAGTTSSSNVLVKKDEGQSSSYWYLESADGNAYMFRNADTGLYLDVSGGNMINGTNIQLWTGNATDAQKWYFIQDGDAYKIISKRNYLTMSLENSLAKNKPNVQMWRDIQVAHQRFYLKPVAETNDNQNTGEEQVINSTLSISGANTVPNLQVGDKFSLKGTITSNYQITKVIAEIYAGSNPIVRKEVYPNATSVSLSGDIDKAMTFNTLAAGTYYYSVWAEDASGAQKTLIWQMFEVKQANSTEKVLNINWQHFKQMGNQAGRNKAGKSSDSCMCFALAYCRTILDGKTHSWKEYDYNGYKRGYYTQYDACGWPAKAKYVKKTSGSQSTVYKAIYNNINAGKPVVVFVKGKRSSWHFITIVGYTGVTSTNSLSAKNFLIMDSCPGTTTQATENMGSVGYSLKLSGKKYLYYVAK